MPLKSANERARITSRNLPCFDLSRWKEYERGHPDGLKLFGFLLTMPGTAPQRSCIRILDAARLGFLHLAGWGLHEVTKCVDMGSPACLSLPLPTCNGHRLVSPRVGIGNDGDDGSQFFPRASHDPEKLRSDFQRSRPDQISRRQLQDGDLIASAAAIVD